MKLFAVYLKNHGPFSCFVTAETEAEAIDEAKTRQWLRWPSDGDSALVVDQCQEIAVD